MNENDKYIVKALITIKRIVYEKDNFRIVLFTVDKMMKGEITLARPILKGEMFKVKVGSQYYITAERKIDLKWGEQYELKSIAANIKTDTPDGKRKYLESLFTEKQVKNMYDTLEDPFDVMLNQGYESLCKIKGCGMKTASLWIARFHDKYDKSRLYIELSDYWLTDSMMDKLLKRYKSAELIIETVKKNPYQLCRDLKGVGFKTIDTIALSGGTIHPYSVNRVMAIIEDQLQTKGYEGQSYVATQTLMDSIIEICGDEIPDEPITEALQNLKDDLWISEDKMMVGLNYFYNLENRIADNLLDLIKATPRTSYKNWEEKIYQLEEEQGWCFDEDQIKGIKKILDNNVCVVTGLAGTGKSSIVAGALRVLSEYSFSQCALAGKAAARLAEVTGKEGKTIHRLLDYGGGKFRKNEENPLDEEIIIVDEISMIDGELFDYLLRAIKPGTKLLLLGDPGQLEAIGSCSIANDMINSGVVPVAYLSTIHRQAANSGIITQSRNVYDGKQIIPKDFVGSKTIGLKEDLILDCYTDKSQTYYKIMQYFATLLEEMEDIMELQIIVPVKNSGDACTWILNNAIQDLYNPASEDKEEYEIFYQKDKIAILREGDKVINVQNNYETHLYKEWTDEDGTLHYWEEAITPIYNGNIGIIKKINIEEEYIIIDFVSIGLIYLHLSSAKTIELGYAITTHKAQGSQFKYVIIGLDMNSYILLNRELVYTAITRAKEKCYLCAQTNALRYAIGTHAISKKKTHLQNHLHRLAYKKQTYGKLTF